MRNFKFIIPLLFVFINSSILSAQEFEINCLITDTNVKQVIISEAEAYIFFQKKLDSCYVSEGNREVKFNRPIKNTEVFVVYTVNDRNITTAAKTLIVKPGINLNLVFNGGFYDVKVSGKDSYSTSFFGQIYREYQKQKWDSLYKINDFEYRQHLLNLKHQLVDCLLLNNKKEIINTDDFDLLKSLINCLYYQTQYSYHKKRSAQLKDSLSSKLMDSFFEFENEIDFENKYFYKFWDFNYRLIGSFIEEKVNRYIGESDTDRYIFEYTMMKEHLSGKSRDVAIFTLLNKFEDWYDSMGTDEFYKNLKKVRNEYSMQCKDKALREHFLNKIDLLLSAEPGNEFIDFSLPDTSGNMVSLSDFEGKIVYINLWATWCGPCIKSLPEYNKLYEAFKPNKNIEIINICYCRDEHIEQWRSLIHDHKVESTSLRCDNPNLFKKYFINGSVPQYIILTKKGELETLKAKSPKNGRSDLLQLLNNKL